MILTIGILAIALYLCGFVYQIRQLRDQPFQKARLLCFAALAISAHGIANFNMIFKPAGVNFSLLHISAGIFFIINLTLLFSSLRKPVQALFLFLFPLSALSLGIGLFSHSTLEPVAHLSLPIGAHIVLSILAYSLLTLASLQALLLAVQNWRLKHKHLKSGWNKFLPPLEVMEALLFEILWAGFALLTLSIITGLLFFDDLFAQHLAHKMFFSILAWFFYVILLWGHQVKGWRGSIAIRWTIGGFIALMLAYWGSKMVLEYLL